MVFDEALADDDLAVLLADMHVTGKIRWDAYEQAKHVSTLYDVHGTTYDWLATHLRLAILIADLRINSREVLPTYRVGAPVVCAPNSSVVLAGRELPLGLGLAFGGRSLDRASGRAARTRAAGMRSRSRGISRAGRCRSRELDVSAGRGGPPGAARAQRPLEPELATGPGGRRERAVGGPRAGRSLLGCGNGSPITGDGCI